jgi:biotin carboxyl carrier protein
MREQVGTAKNQPAFSEHLNDNVSVLEDDYYNEWLLSHQPMIKGLKSALVNAPIEDAMVTVGSLDAQSEYYATLYQIAEEQQNSTQPQVASLARGSAGEVFALIYPLKDYQQNLIALVAMAVEVSSQEELQTVLTAMSWSVSGLEVVEYQQRLQKAEQNQTGIADRVDVLARVLAEPNYASAAVRLVTELATLFNCDRVSLGEYKNRRSRLKHLSHSAQFGKKMNLVRTIEQTMDECVDQGQIIRYPQDESAIQHNEGQLDTTVKALDVVMSHRKLSQLQGDACVLSIPIYLDGESQGALVLEGNPDTPWSNEQAELCQSIASLVLPALEDKKSNDRPIWKKIGSSCACQLGRLLGFGYLGRKLVVLMLLALAFFFYTAVGTYRLSTDARIESATQRAIVAPYDGYINQAFVRAGDQINTGQPLVTMDDKDLRLERLKWLSEQSKLTRQYQEALAVRDRAKINVINAQLEQVKAQLELVTSQLDRGRINAPFSGLVVSGDLSQRLGSAVTKGEGLLEVAPVNSYRIRMLVKESRIADVNLEQRGTLYLSALPELSFPFQLSKVTPLTENIDGATYFVIEGAIDQQADLSLIQPGMEGIGKIEVDERLLISIWTREMLEWIRLRIWTWWG